MGTIGNVLKGLNFKPEPVSRIGILLFEGLSAGSWSEALHEKLPESESSRRTCKQTGHCVSQGSAVSTTRHCPVKSRGSFRLLRAIAMTFPVEWIEKIGKINFIAFQETRVYLSAYFQQDAPCQRIPNSDS
jgi:hypothetical protein